MTDFFKHDSEPFSYVKGGELFAAQRLSTFREEPSVWSQLRFYQNYLTGVYIITRM
jgi:hypothetical protein